MLARSGYKGHKWEESRTKVYLSGQKRGVTPAIKKDINHRSIIEPIIGHAKNDGAEVTPKGWTTIAQKNDRA